MSKASPLKEPPLRNPGQSLDENIRDLVSDYAFGPLVFAFLFVSIAALEWVKYYNSSPPSPLIYSLVAISSLGYATLRFFRVRRELKARFLGRDGEKHVGQKLEQLRKHGYIVFHDLPGEGFNIDHVLIGPTGIFTVETKTRSKPAQRQSTIVFDGETIRIDGNKPDRAPVLQAKAQAKWLEELLSNSTGRNFEVRPVIVYPGWFIEYTGPKSRQIWVLNPKALPSFLNREPGRLSLEEVSLASFHVDRFVRAGVE